MTAAVPWRRWLDLAFDEVDAASANEAIAHHREQRTGELRSARSYEVVVPDPPPPLALFMETLSRRLADHLDSVGLARRGSPDVFLSVFTGGRLYFIESTATLALARELVPPPALPGPVH